MIREYCTYFDQHYLYQGLSLYHSLLNHAGDFCLWILCFDEETYRLLETMRLERVKLIRLKEFENSDLLAVKASRSRIEYFWTATPDLLRFLFQGDANVDGITYLDADLFFFAPPDPIEHALGNGSVLIVEHRYAPEWKFMEQESGTYNVGLLAFRRDENALTCLQWWRERCLEWCYARYEDGKMGDQKYLDEWPRLFRGIEVLKHIGCGVAPWNLSNYDMHAGDNALWVDDVPLIFYHFHQFKPIHPRQFDLAQSYRLQREYVDLIYRPYIAAIQKSIQQVHQIAPDFAGGFFQRHVFGEFKRFLKHKWNIVNL